MSSQIRTLSRQISELRKAQNSNDDHSAQLVLEEIEESTYHMKSSVSELRKIIVFLSTSELKPNINSSNLSTELEIAVRLAILRGMSRILQNHASETPAHWDMEISSKLVNENHSNSSSSMPPPPPSSSSSRSRSRTESLMNDQGIFSLAGNVAWPHPAPNKFTFTCWVKFPAVLEAETVTLLRMGDAGSDDTTSAAGWACGGGLAIELLPALSPKGIALRVVTASRKSVTSKANVLKSSVVRVPLRSNKWQLLSLSIMSRWYRNAPFCVSVDGVTLLEESLPYPNLTMVGGDLSANTSVLLPLGVASQGLKCKVSGFSFYESWLNKNMLHEIFVAGPGQPCSSFPVLSARLPCPPALGGASLPPFASDYKQALKSILPPSSSSIISPSSLSSSSITSPSNDVNQLDDVNDGHDSSKPNDQYSNHETDSVNSSDHASGGSSGVDDGIEGGRSSLKTSSKLIVIASFHAKFGYSNYMVNQTMFGTDEEEEGVASKVHGWRPSGVSSFHKLSLSSPMRAPMCTSSSWLPRQRPSISSSYSSSSQHGGSTNGGMILQFNGSLQLRGMEFLTWFYGCGGLGNVSIHLLNSAIETCKIEHGNEMGYAARQLESDSDALLPWLDKPKFNSWAVKDMTTCADNKAASLSGPAMFVSSILDFVAAVIQTQDTRIVNEFIENNGFHALGATLRRLPPSYLTDHVAESCCRILDATKVCRQFGSSSSSHHAGSTMGSSVLVAACLQGLMFSADLWNPRPMASPKPTPTQQQDNTPSSSTASSSASASNSTRIGFSRGARYGSWKTAMLGCHWVALTSPSTLVDVINFNQFLDAYTSVVLLPKNIAPYQDEIEQITKDSDDVTNGDSGDSDGGSVDEVEPLYITGFRGVVSAIQPLMTTMVLEYLKRKIHSRDLYTEHHGTHNDSNSFNMTHTSSPIVLMLRWITIYCPPPPPSSNSSSTKGKKKSVPSSSTDDISINRKWIIIRSFLIIIYEITKLDGAMTAQLKKDLFLGLFLEDCAVAIFMGMQPESSSIIHDKKKNNKNDDACSTCKILALKISLWYIYHDYKKIYSDVESSKKYEKELNYHLNSIHSHSSQSNYNNDHENYNNKNNNSIVIDKFQSTKSPFKWTLSDRYLKASSLAQHLADSICYGNCWSDKTIDYIISLIIPMPRINLLSSYDNIEYSSQPMPTSSSSSSTNSSNSNQRETFKNYDDYFDIEKEEVDELPPLWLALPFATALLPALSVDQRMEVSMFLSVQIKSEMISHLYDSANTVRSSMDGGKQKPLMGRPSKAVEGFEWVGLPLMVMDAHEMRAGNNQQSSSSMNSHVLYKNQYSSLSDLKQASDLTGEGFLEATIAALACAEYAFLEIRLRNRGEDLESDWMSVNSFGSQATSSSPIEASETVESLTLDCSALLLVELMMIEKRGWQLWRTLTARFHIPSQSSLSQSSILASSSSSFSSSSSSPLLDDLGREVLLKLIGMALNRLSALTPSTFAPAEFGGNQCDEFGTKVHKAGEKASTRGIASLLKQRDGAATKLLDLLNESGLLKVIKSKPSVDKTEIQPQSINNNHNDTNIIKGGGGANSSDGVVLHYGLTINQREVIKCIGGLSRSLLRQATSLVAMQQNESSKPNIDRLKTSSTESMSIHPQTSSDISNISTLSRENSSGSFSGSSGGENIISPSLLAALSVCLQTLLEALPDICLAPPLVDTSKVNHKKDKKNKKNDFENADHKSSISSSIQNVEYGGAEVIAVISDIVFGLSELPGYSSSSIREIVLNTLVAARTSLQSLQSGNNHKDNDGDSNNRTSSEPVPLKGSKIVLENFIRSLINKFGHQKTQVATVRLCSSSNLSVENPSSTSSIQKESTTGATPERIALAIVRSKPLTEVLSPAKGLTSVPEILKSLETRLNAAQQLAQEEKDELVNLFDDFSIHETSTSTSTTVSGKDTQESSLNRTYIKNDDQDQPSQEPSTDSSMRVPPCPRLPIGSLPDCFGTPLSVVGIPALPWETKRQTLTTNSASTSTSKLVDVKLKGVSFDELWLWKRNQLKVYDDSRRTLSQMVTAHSQQRARFVAQALNSQFEQEAMPTSYKPKAWVLNESHEGGLPNRCRIVLRPLSNLSHPLDEVHAYKQPQKTNLEQSLDLGSVRPSLSATSTPELRRLSSNSEAQTHIVGEALARSVFAGRLMNFESEENQAIEKLENGGDDYWSFDTTTATGNNDQSAPNGGGGGGRSHDRKDNEEFEFDEESHHVSNDLQHDNNHDHDNRGNHHHNDTIIDVTDIHHITKASMQDIPVNLQLGPQSNGPPKPYSIRMIEAKYNVVMVTPSASYKGQIILTNKHLFFEPLIPSSQKTKTNNNNHNNDNNGGVINDDEAVFDEDEGLKRWPRRERWPLRGIDGIYLRRFRLRDTALEIFFRRRGLDAWQSDLKVCFFDFGSRLSDGVERRDYFANKVMNLAPSEAVCEWPGGSMASAGFEDGNEQLVAKQWRRMVASWTARWQRHEVGNFEYLMALNTLAGRSFNDLCQYPVMPWVLNDYRSKEEVEIDIAKEAEEEAKRQKEIDEKVKETCRIAQEIELKYQKEQEEKLTKETKVAAEYWTSKTSNSDIENSLNKDMNNAVDVDDVENNGENNIDQSTRSNKNSDTDQNNSSSLSTSSLDKDEKDEKQEKQENEIKKTPRMIGIERRALKAEQEEKEKLRKLREYEETCWKLRVERGRNALLTLQRLQKSKSKSKSKSSSIRSYEQQGWKSGFLIDLQDASLYRDLKKPMGAIDEKRRLEFLERYESFMDADIPSFMYGSHYSTAAGVVLHYLVRLQPFASLHQDLQGGHFDVADRLFKSVNSAWKICTDEGSEVKELTPEWYSAPAFLSNKNDFNFGVCQNGTPVGDVELPYWAKTPEEFIAVQRAALESDYVSNNLHHWVDLIFGYKQRGKAAIEANNVFYYLTYFGMVDISKIEDPIMRVATESQIAHFGQCPRQLFRQSHPRRDGKGRYGPRDSHLRKKFTPQPLLNPYNQISNCLSLHHHHGSSSSLSMEASLSANSKSNASFRSKQTYSIGLNPKNNIPLLQPINAPTLMLKSPRCFYRQEDDTTMVSLMSPPTSTLTTRQSSSSVSSSEYVGVVALRLGNGFGVVVDGAGVIDVFHWELFDPMSEIGVDTTINHRASSSTAAVSSNTNLQSSSTDPSPLSSQTTIENDMDKKKSEKKKNEDANENENKSQDESQVGDGVDGGVHSDATEDAEESDVEPPAMRESVSNTAENTKVDKQKHFSVQLQAWRLEPAFDEIPRLPSQHCPPLSHQQRHSLKTKRDKSKQVQQQAAEDNEENNNIMNISDDNDDDFIVKQVNAVISASGRFIISGGRFGSLALQQIDLTSGLVVGEFLLPEAHDGAVTCLALSQQPLDADVEGTAQDNKLLWNPNFIGSEDWLLTGGSDGVARVWQLRLIDLRKHGGASISKRPWKVLRGHQDGITCCALSNELKVAVTCSGSLGLIHPLDDNEYSYYSRFYAITMKDFNHIIYDQSNGIVINTNNDDEENENDVDENNHDINDKNSMLPNSDIMIRLEKIHQNHHGYKTVFKQCCVSSVCGLVAFYFIKMEYSQNNKNNISNNIKTSHFIQIHSINGGISGNSIQPCLEEIEVDSQVLHLSFINYGKGISISTLHNGIEIRHIPHLHLIACQLSNHKDKQDNVSSFVSSSLSSKTKQEEEEEEGRGGGGGGGGIDDRDVENNEQAISLDWIATCIDWAPDPAHPGIMAIGDKYGGIKLIGLSDIEEFAKHMPIRHHRSGGIRQAVSSVKAGLRTKTKGIASSTKAVAAGAFSEAKYLVKDVKEKGLLKGVMGFFS